ncbi:methyltransferase domain-containing protein [Pseudomonas sp. TH03]|uniref:class I SAM-dependent methyltransferase n=1 Tax=Pseudomonas sp. TH03 TaxID=2796369 RepID=UPI0019143826|nr:methyltransferase domain-containing protein [Pseudomonas sp. TH03]MBK5552224.1 methyltransferase domain-containing protein [Pseudomonas sp. TH03]
MSQTDQKLHLGCGSIQFPGWVNIDLDSPTADLLLDLTEPLPFADGSVSHIFNEHFIEHVSREQAVAFLKECHRVLVPGGAIRITTPNLRFLTFSYLSNTTDEWGDLWQPNSRCQMMNEGMRSWGHQFVYDAEELVRVLGEAGFKSVVFQPYRESSDEVFAGLEARPFHNELIVEARMSDSVDVEINFGAMTKNEAEWNIHLDDSQQSKEQASVRTELESVARAEFIDALTAHIRKMEALEATQAQVIGSLTEENLKTTQELAIQAQTIELLKLQMGKVEAELAALSSS